MKNIIEIKSGEGLPLLMHAIYITYIYESFGNLNGTYTQMENPTKLGLTFNS